MERSAVRSDHLTREMGRVSFVFETDGHTHGGELTLAPSSRCFFSAGCWTDVDMARKWERGEESVVLVGEGMLRNRLRSMQSWVRACERERW